MISYIPNTELHLDMLAQTETNIEYNSSSNRIQTILPHVDMEQYTVSNIITAPYFQKLIINTYSTCFLLLMLAILFVRDLEIISLGLQL